MRQQICLLLLLLVGLTGCAGMRKKKVAYNEPQAVKVKEPTFAQLESSNVPRTMKDIKQPAQLFLAYGAWEAQLGHYPEARVAYQQALEKEPKNIDAFLGLAELSDLEGKKEQAEREYLKLVAEHPESGKVRSRIGRFYVAQRRFPEALVQFEAGYKLDPTSKEANLELGVVLAELGRHQVALTHMSKSVGETAAQINIAVILRRQGQQGLADQYLARARQRDPNGYQAAILQASHSEAASANQTVNRPAGMAIQQVPMTVESKPGIIPESSVTPIGIEAMH
ncbi:tetratricopeptide repeat protein [Lacunimicrobium album]